MADISRISRLFAGVQRGIDLPNNSLVMQSLKVSADGGSTSTELTKAILDQLITHRTSDGSDHSIVNTNATHVSGDGSDHADVATNTTHSTGDGSDHANVALNDTHRASDGKDHSDVVLNNTHRASDGSDHSIVNTNATHVSGDGSDHADVATNTTHSTGDGSDHADVASNTTHSSSNGSDHSYVGNLQTLSGKAAGSTNHGSFTGGVLGDTETTNSALQALETYAEATRSLVQNFEWQPSAKDYITDNTQAPPTEVDGDRYILAADGGAPHADWDGAEAGDIVEFVTDTWVETDPSVGMFIAVDDDSSGIYQWGGAAWSFKAFEATTASTGLTKSSYDIQIADAAKANGISISSGVFTAECDNSTIELSSNEISVKASGIGENELNNVDGGVDAQSFVLTSGYAASAGNPAAADTIEAAIQKIDGNVDANTSAISSNTTHSTGDGSDHADVATNTTHSTGDGTDHSAVSGHLDGGANKHDASEIDVEAADGNYYSAGSAEAAIGSLDDQIKTNADAISALGDVENLSESRVAGEAFLAAGGAFAVREAKGGETAGRVYKADKDATSNDNFHVVGICDPTVDKSAGDSMSVIYSGPMTITGHGFTQGAALFLGSSGALIEEGSLADTAGEAAKQVAVVRDANTIMVQIMQANVA